MPRVKALTELGVRCDQDAALFRKACLEAADGLGAALAGVPEEPCSEDRKGEGSSDRTASG